MNLKITGRDQLETLAGIVGVCSETRSLELVSTGQACFDSGRATGLYLARGCVLIQRGILKAVLFPGDYDNSWSIYLAGDFAFSDIAVGLFRDLLHVAHATA